MRWRSINKNKSNGLKSGDLADYSIDSLRPIYLSRNSLSGPEEHNEDSKYLLLLVAFIVVRKFSSVCLDHCTFPLNDINPFNICTCLRRKTEIQLKKVV